MEGLTQNKPLLYSIVLSGGTVLALTLGIVPELAAQFEIIEFPSEVSNNKTTGIILYYYIFVLVSYNTRASLIR